MLISRHARSRMKLYKITSEDILLAIREPELSDQEGENRIAVRQFDDKYGGYPLKVVYRADTLMVVTVYPLKRKNWSRP